MSEAGNLSVSTWEEAVRWCMSQPDMKDLAQAAYFDQPLIAANRYHRSAEFKALKSFLPERPGRALDLGAGNGILSWALAHEGWRVTAVEPDPSALIGANAIRTLAAEAGGLIDVVEAFGEAIPADTAGYELVAARQVLHHAKDLTAFCKEMARLGKKGARVLTLRDHVISNKQQLETFLANHPLHRRYGGENAFTLMQYKQALEDAGIKIDKQLRSFQSVMNYDPMTVAEIKGKIVATVGPAAPAANLLLKALPDETMLNLAALLDRRAGRLVSFIGTVI